MNSFKKIMITVVLFILVIAFSYYIYRTHLQSGWTRDGKIRADVILVSSQVEGNIEKSYVQDNQLVRKGQLLFELDTKDYVLALNKAIERNNMNNIELQRLKNMKSRRDALANFGLSQEEVDNVNLEYKKAIAIAAASSQEINKARLDLTKTKIYAPVDGYVTNLQIHQGDYLEKGKAIISLIQKNSFYAYAYFQENLIGKIKIGQAVQIHLLNGNRLEGKIESLSMGVQDNSNHSENGGIHDVNPTFEWIRLPARIPVRIYIDPKQQGYDQLVAGMTATVNLQQNGR